MYNNYACQLFYSKIKNANVFFLRYGMKSTYSNQRYKLMRLRP